MTISDHGSHHNHVSTERSMQNSGMNSCVRHTIYKSHNSFVLTVKFRLFQNLDFSDEHIMKRVY